MTKGFLYRAAFVCLLFLLFYLCGSASPRFSPKSGIGLMSPAASRPQKQKRPPPPVRYQADFPRPDPLTLMVQFRDSKIQLNGGLKPDDGTMSGSVVVEVLVDETGKVVSARALAGLSLFREPARQAALKATFSPTKFAGNPVKVKGVIVYKFVG